MKTFDKNFVCKRWFLNLSNCNIAFDLVVQYKQYYILWLRIGYKGKYIDIDIFNKHFNIYNWK